MLNGQHRGISKRSDAFINVIVDSDLYKGCLTDYYKRNFQQIEDEYLYRESRVEQSVD